MGKDHSPLRDNETLLAIQARIEGLTLPQLIARDEYVRLKFSLEVATRLARAPLAPSEENWNRLQEAMRELGWAEDQVEARTQAFLKLINDVVDKSFVPEIQQRKERP